MTNKKRWLSIIYVVCLGLFFSSIPYSLFIDNEYISLGLSIISKIVGIILILYYEKKDNLIHNKITKFDKNDLLFIPFIFVCMSNIFVGIINQSLITTIPSYSLLALNLLVCLTTAILEELLFRYLIQHELLKSFKPLKAIIYSSLIFGSIHILNISSFSQIPFALIQVLYTAVLGLMLGLIYYKSKNILYPIIFHFLFNFINSYLSTTYFNMEWNNIFFIVNISISIIFLVYGIFIYRKEFIKNAS